MDQKFFRCDICGNLVGMIHSSGVPLVCCGQEMTELEGNTTDASVEKHVPAVTVDGNEVTVTIGEVEHPMLPEHFIEWVYVKTPTGGHRRELKPNGEPVAKFMLTPDETAETVFAYCNLHGLWMTEL